MNVAFREYFIMEWTQKHMMVKYNFSFRKL